MTQKRYYIGIMTGNSMDAVDMAYVCFDGRINLLCFDSIPFSADMQKQTAELREFVRLCKTRVEIENSSLFQFVHQGYITQVAQAVTSFIVTHQIDLKTLNAICFHGKTLDHCPPSRVVKEKINGKPYTIQMGSGQQLADLTARLLAEQTGFEHRISVIYDFRSDDIFNGGEGAPLIPVFNAFMAKQDGVLNRIDINAGNTSNLCVIQDGKAKGGWDLGPCNEYPDYLIRTYTDLPFDRNGQIAKGGRINQDLLQKLFEKGQNFYQTKPPKSGDPMYYNTQEIIDFQCADGLADKVRTCLYFSAYLMVYGLQFVKGTIPANFSLFGGGWKNPVLFADFQNILNQQGLILPTHQTVFADIYARLAGQPMIRQQQNGQATESMLMALMGAYFDLNYPWTQPCLTGCQTPTVCGLKTTSDTHRITYADCLCRACFD